MLRPQSIRLQPRVQYASLSYLDCGNIQKAHISTGICSGCEYMVVNTQTYSYAEVCVHDTMSIEKGMCRKRGVLLTNNSLFVHSKDRLPDTMGVCTWWIPTAHRTVMVPFGVKIFFRPCVLHIFNMLSDKLNVPNKMGVCIGGRPGLPQKICASDRFVVGYKKNSTWSVSSYR